MIFHVRKGAILGMAMNDAVAMHKVRCCSAAPQMPRRELAGSDPDFSQGLFQSSTGDFQ
jgi:hypothetical protein